MPKRTPKTEPITAPAGATVTPITKKPKRAKQGELAGIEAESHPTLDPLMEEHATIGERMGADRQRLGELNAQMLQEAAKLKVTTYRHPTAVPELVLTVTERTAKVKVKKVKHDEDEGDAEATA